MSKRLSILHKIVTSLKGIAQRRNILDQTNDIDVYEWTVLDNYGSLLSNLKISLTLSVTFQILYMGYLETETQRMGFQMYLHPERRVGLIFELYNFTKPQIDSCEIEKMSVEKCRENVVQFLIFSESHDRRKSI